LPFEPGEAQMMISDECVKYLHARFGLAFGLYQVTVDRKSVV
jgi:hypothetical protein